MYRTNIFIFHIAKKYTIFAVNFPKKFLLSPFSSRIMLSCAIVKTLFNSQYVFINQKTGLLLKS